MSRKRMSSIYCCQIDSGQPSVIRGFLLLIVNKLKFVFTYVLSAAQLSASYGSKMHIDRDNPYIVVD